MSARWAKHLSAEQQAQRQPLIAEQQRLTAERKAHAYHQYEEGFACNDVQRDYAGPRRAQAREAEGQPPRDAPPGRPGDPMIAALYVDPKGAYANLPGVDMGRAERWRARALELLGGGR